MRPMIFAGARAEPERSEGVPTLTRAVTSNQTRQRKPQAVLRSSTLAIQTIPYIANAPTIPFISDIKGQTMRSMLFAGARAERGRAHPYPVQ